MKTKNTLRVFVVCLALLLSLAVFCACNDKAEEENADTAQTTELSTDADTSEDELSSESKARETIKINKENGGKTTETTTTSTGNGGSEINEGNDDIADDIFN